jgi:PKHD-type hydroxylase
MNSGDEWSFDTDNVEHWAYSNNIFTSEECQKIIAETNELKDGVVNKDTVDKNTRKSKVCFIYPNKDNVWIFERLANVVASINDQFFNFDLFGFAEGLQFTKYEAPDEFYAPHTDKAYGGTIRKLSISVQLSDSKEYEGGDLLLHSGKEPIKMPKDIGKLIVFPSYTLHEVTPVTKGTRYSLVAWVSGKPFK